MCCLLIFHGINSMLQYTADHIERGSRHQNDDEDHQRGVPDVHFRKNELIDLRVVLG